MHPLRLRLSRTRARLALRLGLRASTGLGFFALLALAGAAASVWAGSAALRLSNGGESLPAFAAGLGALLAAVLAWRFGAWLAAPVERPEGVRLPEVAARRLHHVVGRMSRRFGNVRIDAIWVTGDMNAAILQRPRWGCVGPMETHLIIGLPLVHSVSRRQFGAILAHEFAHLACQRQGSAVWLNHFRAWWFRVLDRCVEGGGWFGRLLDRLTIGDLHAALRLARFEEFEADAVAARVIGPRIVAEALIEVALKERFLSEDYWRKVMAQSQFRPRPSIRPYREMGLGVLAGFRRPSSGQRDIHALLAEHRFAPDFHPSLAERLAALGVRPAVSRAEHLSAADAYLAPLLPGLSWVFDRMWWQGSRDAWRRNYQLSRMM